MKRLRIATEKVIWYSCALILILSLPTFSYLVPQLRTGDPSRTVADASSGGRVSSQGSNLGSQGFNWFQADGGQGVASRFVPSSQGPAAARVLDQRDSVTESLRVAEQPGSESHPGRVGPTAGESRRQALQSADESLGSRYGNEALEELESEFNMVLSQLFPGRISAGALTGNENPFKDELTDDAGGNPDQGGDAGEVDDNTGGDPTGGGDGNSGGQEPPPQPGDDEPNPPRFDFMVVSKYGSKGTAVASINRATRSGYGAFMLDSGLTIDLFSGMVGVPRPMFLSQPFEQFSVGSPETIRGSDIFLAQLGPQGTIVSFFRRNSQSGWSAEFSTLVPYQVFRAFALFDYDRDGDLEFLAAIEGAAALTVYEQGQSGLEYSGKVKLPFVPGALVSTEDVSTLGESYLHVFDRELRNSVTFSSLYSGVYSFSKPTTFKKKTIVQLDPPSDAAVGAVYAVLEYVDRVVILEQVAGFRQIASFPSWPGVPTVVVGDIQGTGSPQVLLVP